MGRKILRILFALLIMLSANLTTKVLVWATVDDRPLSPRLAALQDRLKSGDRNAIDNFWKEITESGAPIVEAVHGNDRDVLVTILWRGTEETRNAFVFQLPGVDKPMARLLDTDLWYKTFRFQKGVRFVYRLATNLPDPKEWTSLPRFANAMRTESGCVFGYSQLIWGKNAQNEAGLLSSLRFSGFVLRR